MKATDFVPKIHTFDTLDSTNVKLRELASQGAGEGTVVIATQQTQGRGRNKRTWSSPEGGLYLSALLYPRDKKKISELPLVAGVALAQAAKELLPKSIDVSVKWPNDCLLNWKKVGGILCESLGENFFHLSIIGIGLNVNVPNETLTPFLSNPFSATSFLAETGGKFDLLRAREVVLSKLFNVYRLYKEQGFTPIQFLWERNCGLVGKKVELSDSGAPQKIQTGSEIGRVTGTFLGIDENGAVVLSNAKGERHTYHAGEITCFWP